MITLINYGVGNISSFLSAYHKLNITVQVVSDPDSLGKDTHIILPGVGAFKNAMKNLESTGFIEPLSRLVLEKRCNILGVCVGFQMMGLQSDESPRTKGLGWIKMSSVKLSHVHGEGITLPHMGWNIASQKKDCPLLHSLNSNEFYFLHSYGFNSDDSDSVTSEFFYGNRFISTFSKQNIFGTQFHPEKSHKQGLRILKNFAETDLC